MPVRVVRDAACDIIVAVDVRARGLHPEPIGIEDLEQRIAPAHHLACPHVGHRDHTTDRRFEFEFFDILLLENAALLAQSLEFGSRIFDVALRHHSRYARKTRQLLLGNLQLACHFGPQLLHRSQIGNGDRRR